jgi:hypothetical protein
MADLLRSFLSQSQHSNIQPPHVEYRSAGETDGLDPACITINFVDAGTMVFLTPTIARNLLTDLGQAMHEYDVQTGKVLPNE